MEIACSLDADQTRLRASDWHALARSVVGVERSDQTLTVLFDNAVRDEVSRLVVAEQECCGFATWELAEDGDQIVLTISGDEFGVAALAESLSAWGLAP